MTISTLILAAFLSSAQLVSLDAKEMDPSDFFRFMGQLANINVVRDNFKSRSSSTALPANVRDWVLC